MLGVVAFLASVGVLVSSISPAAGQSASVLDPAAVTGTIDPASIVDIEGFSARAEAWADAQVDHRAAALARAEELAAETKEAEAEAEDARIAAQEAAAEQARQQAEADRRAAEAAATTTTAPAPTVTDPGDGSSGDAAAAVAADDAAAADGAAGDTGTADGGDAVAAPAGAPTPAQWLALRECEASNNYTAVSASGRYRGAYQFSIATWDWLAGSRYPELVGVDPIAASPAQQDQMAMALYDVYGVSPWPICGQLLL